MQLTIVEANLCFCQSLDLSPNPPYTRVQGEYNLLALLSSYERNMMSDLGHNRPGNDRRGVSNNNRENTGSGSDLLRAEVERPQTRRQLRPRNPITNPREIGEVRDMSAGHGDTLDEYDQHLRPPAPRGFRIGLNGSAVTISTVSDRSSVYNDRADVESLGSLASDAESIRLHSGSRASLYDAFSARRDGSDYDRGLADALHAALNDAIINDDMLGSRRQFTLPDSDASSRNSFYMPSRPDAVPGNYSNPGSSDSSRYGSIRGMHPGTRSAYMNAVDYAISRQVAPGNYSNLGDGSRYGPGSRESLQVDAHLARLAHIRAIDAALSEDAAPDNSGSHSDDDSRSGSPVPRRSTYE